jgi:hypothetical protein
MHSRESRTTTLGGQGNLSYSRRQPGDKTFQVLARLPAGAAVAVEGRGRRQKSVISWLPAE